MKKRKKMTKKKRNKKRNKKRVQKEVGKVQREVRKGRNQVVKAARNHARRRVMGTATVKVASRGPSIPSRTSEQHTCARSTPDQQNIALSLLLTNTFNTVILYVHL